MIKPTTTQKPIPAASLLGSAIGDALGAGVELMSIREIRNKYVVDGIKDYCEFPDGHGEFTDDTQMTLFTAEGLLRANHRAILKGIGGADVPITYQSYIRWLNTQGRSSASIPEGWGTYDLESGWLIKEKAMHQVDAVLPTGYPNSEVMPFELESGLKLLHKNWQENADQYCDKNKINMLVSHLFFANEEVELPKEPEEKSQY